MTIAIKFLVKVMHLEIAAVALLVKGIKPNKKLIKKELVDMFSSGGIDGAVDWVADVDYETHINKARNITRNLYHDFY